MEVSVRGQRVAKIIRSKDFSVVRVLVSHSNSSSFPLFTIHLREDADDSFLGQSCLEKLDWLGAHQPAQGNRIGFIFDQERSDHTRSTGPVRLTLNVDYRCAFDMVLSRKSFEKMEPLFNKNKANFDPDYSLLGLLRYNKPAMSSTLLRSIFM